MSRKGSSVRRKLRSSASGETAQSDVNPAESKDVNPSRLKRKQSMVEEDDQGVVIRSKKKKQDLEDGVISAGPKTSRTRLLQLLENRVSRKKGRFSIEVPESTSSTLDIAQGQHDKSTAEDQAVTTNSNGINFQIYSNTQLENMLRDVGLDTFGMDKSKLIECCKTYEGLIILPVTNVQPEPSNAMQGSFTFSAKSKYKDDILAASSPERVASTSAIDNSSLEGSSKCGKSSYQPENLPSLEHGTFLYPRPRPTDLSKQHPIPPKSRKGKEKERRESDSEYLPEDDEMFEHPNLEPDVNQIPKSKGMQDEVVSEKEATDEEASKTLPSLQELTKLWKESRAALVKANKRIETLECEFENLSNFVRTSLGNQTDQESSQPRGGRTAACVRFHIEMMFGLKSALDPLPPPATTEEQEEWNCEEDLDDIAIDLHQPSGHGNVDSDFDPCFPYPNGPGHQEASPQQLSVTWQLMKAAHVTSFRPNLTKSPSSQQNKRIWGLSERIFFKLVDLGVYTGVSLDKDNIPYVKKCFSSHIQTLMKRYRQQTWDDDRKERMASSIRRATRSCRVRMPCDQFWNDGEIQLNSPSTLTFQLRKARTKVALEEKTLWPLLPLITSACSDDETDAEEGQNITPGKGLICARKLLWRSVDLEGVLVCLDARKGRLDQSVPKDSNSPQRGRPSRQRIRRDNAPESLIEAPEGLPKDCYSTRFLEKLGSKGQIMLQIKPEIGLTRIIQTLDSL